MAFNRASHRQKSAIILSSMGFLLWGGNEGVTRNLEEEAHGFNKWQLGLVSITEVQEKGGQSRSKRGKRSRLPALPVVLKTLTLAPEQRAVAWAARSVSPRPSSGWTVALLRSLLRSKRLTARGISRSRLSGSA